MTAPTTGESFLAVLPKEFRCPVPPSPAGGFFVVHSAFGKIGETSVGGVEIIGVDGAGYSSTFYDCFGNVHRSRLEIEGDVLRWIGDRTRCTVTLTDDGLTQVARHESSPDGVSWTPTMNVTLRKSA